VKLVWFIVVAPGLEQILADEVAEMGLRPSIIAGGVEVVGDLQVGWKILLRSRVAAGLRLRVCVFQAKNAKSIGSVIRGASWSGWVHPAQDVVVVASVRESPVKRTAVEGAARRGIAESLRGPRLPGRRRPRDPARVHVRVEGRQITVSLDAAGELLHRRGWRKHTTAAPLRENLAAAILRAADWKFSESLLDPMCGSGTLPIEAACAALGIAPGARRRFAIEDWPAHNEGEWRRAVKQAMGRRSTKVHISGSDRDVGAIAAARENARRAGVGKAVEWDVRDVRDLGASGGPGLVICNPPWGGRLATGQAKGVWRAIGDCMRSHYSDWRWALLGPDPALVRAAALPMREVLSFPAGGTRVRLWVGSKP
jgi:putative N6-adenine-specific DNA methylase